MDRDVKGRRRTGRRDELGGSAPGWQPQLSKKGWTAAALLARTCTRRVSLVPPTSLDTIGKGRSFGWSRVTAYGKVQV